MLTMVTVKECYTNYLNNDLNIYSHDLNKYRNMDKEKDI